MPRGAQHPNWKGGRWLSSKGYWWVKVPTDHPCNRAGRQGYAPEHLLVFWQTHGRVPYDGYHIHHRDGDKTNNAPDNLEEREQCAHGRHHLTSERARELGRKGGKATARMRRRARRLGALRRGGARS